MKRKLLIIVGSTATGKTSLALSLARQLNGEIVSADSRQVYKGLDIGTGKDFPKNVSKQTKVLTNSDQKTEYYMFGEVPVWGIDIVSPFEKFNVSFYVDYANKVIEDIWQRNRLAIVVGGTGFYIKGLVDGIDTMRIPKDENLRQKLMSQSSEELFSMLLNTSPTKALSLNSSDRKNPIRLMRAIEVSEWEKSGRQVDRRGKGLKNVEALFIGLTLPREELYRRIESRVHERLRSGLLNEIESLVKSGLTWDLQSMNTLSYKEWKKYFEHSCTEQDAVFEWIRHEKNYAKRQITWFRKDKRIHWFDTTNKDYPKEVVNIVETWNNNRDASEN